VPAVDDTPAMIGNNDPVNAAIGTELCILARQDAREDDLALMPARSRVMKSHVKFPAVVPVTPWRSMPSKLGLRAR
jgi:hypothetical protein